MASAKARETVRAADTVRGVAAAAPLPPEIQLLPLVPNLALPTAAPASTRTRVPSGYGIQEQCVPFTAATALGLLVRSPITFGLCPAADVPVGAHAFRSPLEDAGIAPRPDENVFYVHDDPHCRFAGNAFALDPPPTGARGVRARRVMPGLSFFERPDQVDLFKLHLPIVWRTPPDLHVLFLPMLNRPGPEVLAGLVETDWYATPVNLVLRRPRFGTSLHVAAGDPLAQLCVIERSNRRPVVKVVPSHARLARELRTQLSAWDQRHATDRSAYKRMVREHQRALP